MSRISIAKVRDDRPPVEYRVKLDAKLNQELELYRRLYVQTYGQEIEAKDLLEPMIRRCLASDRLFNKFKRDMLGGATAPPEQPKSPT